MKKKSSYVKMGYFAVVLALSVLLIAVMGTMAWYRHVRSLQTLTAIQVTELTLTGPNDNTIAIDLGGINVSEAGSQQYVFGVKSNKPENYWIQLGYTTNIPLTYTVYMATKKNTPSDGEPGTWIGSDFFSRGNALNDPDLIRLNHVKQHDKTYEPNNQVQEMADPKYWQYGPIHIEKRDIQYFILEITWGQLSDGYNKETDMIYLTIGTSGITGNSASGGGESS